MKFIKNLIALIVFIIGGVITLAGVTLSIPGKIVQNIGVCLVALAAGIKLSFDFTALEEFSKSLQKLQVKCK